MVPSESSINQAIETTDNMIFFINPTSTHLGSALICDLWLFYKNLIKLNWNL